jgi:hypothetical protein
VTGDSRSESGGVGYPHVRSSLRDELARALSEVVRGRLIVLAGAFVDSELIRETLRMAGASGVRTLTLERPRALEAEEWTRLAHHTAALQQAVARPTIRTIRNFAAIDPAENALVYAGSFVAGSSFCGRRLMGARKRAWFEAERKDRQAKWIGAQAGVQQRIVRRMEVNILSRTVSAALEDGAVVLTGLPRGYLELDTSHGYLLPAIARRSHTLDRTIRFLAEGCWGARLSRFTPGRPVTCYFYKVRDTLLFSGAFEATSYVDWRDFRIRSVGIMGPTLLMSSAQRESLHQLARRFAESVSYQGAFCVDGVLTRTRFVAHEINPRLCSGHKQLDAYLDPPVPAALVDMAIREGLVAESSALVGELSRVLQSLDRLRTLTSFGWLPTQAARLQAACPRNSGSAQLARWRSQVLREFRSRTWTPIRTLGADGMP